MPASKNTLLSPNGVAPNRGHVPTVPRAPAAKTVPPRQKMLGAVVIGVALCAFAGYFIWKWIGYQKVYNDFVITRVLPAPARVQIQDMFTPLLKRAYIDGQGLRVFFITQEESQPDERIPPLRKFEGQPDGKMPPPQVFLESFKKYDAETAPVRNKEIDRARAQLEQAVAKFNTPAQFRIIIFADNTTDDQLAAPFVAQWYDRLELERLLGAGWSVWLRFHRISEQATTLYDPSPIELPAKADMTQTRREVLTSMTTVFAPTHAAHSAIATGMFDALQEDAREQPIDRHTRILLFSDLHENDPDTLSFERPPLTDPNYLRSQIDDPAGRKELENRMQTVLKCPPLNGAHVDVFFPPNQDHLRRSRMLVLFPLWRELFVSHGAASDVGEHF